MKCWIRRAEDRHHWELGCQQCGRVVFEDWVWGWVIWALDLHVQSHREEACA